MTTSDFINLHLLPAGNSINFAKWMNVLYNPIGVNPDTGLTEGRIEAVTITRECLSFNGNTNLIATDIEEVLNQCETITFIFNNTEYRLNVENRAFYEGTTGVNSFFYFEVTCETLVPNTFTAALDSPEFNVTVFFEPFLNSISFDSSEFNPLFNNGTVLRRSSVRMEADKEEGSTKPTNFAAILSTSASKAAVQDSFYSDTGIINARYVGSKSTPDTYAGVKPAISAREYKGEIHPPDASEDVVCGLTNAERITVNILHTGPDRTPSFSSSSLGIRPSTALGPNDEFLSYGYASLTGQRVPDIDVGDIIKVAGNDKELMRVTEHNTFNRIILIQRRYMESPASQTIQTSTDLFKVDRTDNYRIDDFVRSLTAINNSQIYVTETNSILLTDDFGNVYGSSLCPEPINANFAEEAGSDRRLKYNIKLVGKSPSDINIYNFEYKDKDKFGYGVYQGVMSDEVIKEAVAVGADGYDRVKYSLLDVEFKKLKD